MSHDLHRLRSLPLDGDAAAQDAYRRALLRTGMSYPQGDTPSARGWHACEGQQDLARILGEAMEGAQYDHRSRDVWINRELAVLYACIRLGMYCDFPTLLGDGCFSPPMVDCRRALERVHLAHAGFRPVTPALYGANP